MRPPGAMTTATDFEKLGVFYLGRPYDPATRKPRPGLVLYDSKDLVTHAVCVGMTGSGKTGLCLALLEEAAHRRHPGHRHRSQGRSRQPAADVSRAAPGGLRAVDQRGRRAAARASRPTTSRAQQAELWRKGLAEWGEDGARIQRLRDAADFAIYTPGSDGRTARLDPQVVRRAARGDPRRRRALPRAHRQHGDEPARPPRHRRRSAQEPRAHPALDHPRRPRGARAATSISASLIQADPEAARRAASACSISSRSIPRRIASRWRWRSTTCSPRRASPPGSQGEPLDIGRMLCTRPRASRAIAIFSIAHLARRRAHVLRLAPAEPDARLDARAARHDEPARAPLHGRDLRLLPARRQPAVEAAAADAAQAGARLRPRRRAGDAEPGRPRLQGAVQRRHVVHRPAADRARQGARARRAGRRGRRRGQPLRPRPRWSRSSPASATASS